jgi:ATP-dependent helicase HrpB
MRPVFPIDAIKTSFLNALSANKTVILSAPPGAGKSTVLPLWLLNIDKFSQQKIYLLQPRRIAAKNIATYLAKQLGEPVGETIGYRLRNESKVGKNTRLEVITEGILTQIIQKDAELSGCGLVIFDEFHLRSASGDMAFALARDCQQGLRDDLSLLIMSATLDNQQLQQKLPDACALKSEGRSFTVALSYQAPKNTQYWREHAVSVIKSQLVAYQNTNQAQNSILVFVAGLADIRYMVERLAACVPNNVALLPLYGDLSLTEQQRVIAPAPAGHHKLVIATNIAETSLTIEGINCVIDCGFENVAQYDHGSLLNRLVQKQISKSSAIQRAGRAGRLMEGKCIRLYSKDDFDRRAEHNISEIQQTDLLPSLIEAARWGVSQLSDLPLLELPAKTKEQQAWQTLINLNIVNQQHKLTLQGEQIAQLSCHPRFAHMIIQAKALTKDEPLALLACYVAALLEEKDLYASVQAKTDSDLRHRLIDLLHGNITSKNITQQAKRLAKQLALNFHCEISDLQINKVGFLLAIAYPERVAKARATTGDYIAVNGKGFSVNHADKLSEEQYLVAAQLIDLTNQANLQARLVAPISLAEINVLFADQITTKTVLVYNEKLGRIEAFEGCYLGKLMLTKSMANQQPTPRQIAELWSALVKQKGIDFQQYKKGVLIWSDDALKLINRWRWLNNFVNEAGLPVLNEAYLLAALDSWFTPFVGSIKTKSQLAKLKHNEMLLTLLSYQQQQLLTTLAPEYYLSPTGRRCVISYVAEQQSPKVSLPMQEVYGLQQTPCVGKLPNNQGIPLVLSLLSPAGRPIQVTQNLTEFWLGSYKAVQKEMKSRYPKHYWPDNPAKAKATNKVKRFIIE